MAWTSTSTRLVQVVLEVDLCERKGAVQRRNPRLPRRDPAPHHALRELDLPD